MTLVSTVRNLALAAGLALSLSACGINSVPTAEENAKAKWADVEAQYQRRANLIPNLVEVTQGAAENERAILTEVTEARARATSVNISTDDLGDASKMQEFAAAQGQLSQGLGRLLASFEAYPTRTSLHCKANLKARKIASRWLFATTTKPFGSITPRSAPSPTLSERTSFTGPIHWSRTLRLPKALKSLLKST